MADSLPTRFTPFPREAIEQSIPARFEEQVDRQSDRVALKALGATLTYRELDNLANQVAHGILRRWGEGVEPIGLLMSQGPSLIAAILGILKAGRPYVPMDPCQPVTRSASMLSDAGVTVCVTDRAGPDLTGPTVRFDDLTAGTPSDRPALEIPADTTAYIYYTSGSTGRPKGVYDIHRNVLHNIMRYTNTLEIAPEDRMTLLQSPAFSGAVSSMLGALLNGARLCAYDVGAEGSGRRLGRWVEREGITIYHSVPSLFRSFLEPGTRYHSVRVVRLEGDVASRVDLELFRVHFDPGCRLVNGLGATETGLSRQFFVDRGTPLPAGLVPVGYPTPDMQAIVLDESGTDAGTEVVGEIAIRSCYLAAGYWRQPELTAARFRPDPSGSGARIYRTGDLGRLRIDGCLEFLGRKDGGLKIRGHRVEPAEVEQVLRNVAPVREAVIVVQRDHRDEPLLAAYLIPGDKASITIPALRRTLARELPDYMIPQRFMLVDGFPLNENGKVDRRALAEGQIRSLQGTGTVPPRDPVEQELVTIWEGILGVHPIGATDNFFDVGGDSLLAATLLLDLERMSGRDLPPTTVLTAPSVEQQARVVRGELLPAAGTLVPIRTVGARTPFFCFPEHNGQVGSSFAVLAKHVDPVHPFYGLQSAGFTGGEPLLTSMAAIASHHLATIRTVQPSGPYYLGGRCFGAEVALEVAHQLIQQGESVGLLFLIEVTPDDFSNLAAPAAVRRFRRYRRREGLKAATREIFQQMGRRRLWKKAPYVVREVGRKGLARVRAGRLRWRIARGLAIPDSLREVALVNQVASGLHRSRTYPGRVTLILRSDPPGMYSENPGLDWDRLATGYTVRYLPGLPSDFRRESQLREVAAFLNESLHAASSRS